MARGVMRHLGVIAIVVVWFSWSVGVWAQGSGAHGAKTGDGSTPFTGLGKAPEANMFVGSATSEVPIVVPPGRAGIQPTLRLVYSSHAGPSPYGYGWDLPLGHVQRSTRDGAVLCGRESNQFQLLLPGAQVECNLEGERCWPTVEESFLRIEYRSAANFWVVWDRSGRRYEFGNAENGREPHNPLPGCATFRWYLTRVEDLNGNYMVVDYDTNARRDTAYPRSIRYTGNARTGLDPKFEVRFVWRTEQFRCAGNQLSGRPCDDRVIDAIGGYPRELDRLLDALDVLFEGQLVRRYALEYEFDLGGAWRRRAGRQSFLSAVTLFDGRGLALARADGEPASTTFYYRNLFDSLTKFLALAQAIPKPVYSPPAWPRQQDGTPYPADLEEDRKSLRRTVAYGRSRSTFRDILDINGDGFPDIVDVNRNCMRWRDPLTLESADWDVYLGSAGGFSATPTKWSVRVLVEDEYGVFSDQCPAIRWTDTDTDARQVRSLTDVLDIDGDGFPDYVTAEPWSPSRPNWLVSRGVPPERPGDPWRFAPPVTFPAPAAALRRTNFNVRFLGYDNGSADMADLVDMNGDGRPDYVSVRTDGVWVWINQGTRFAASPMRLTTPWSMLRFTTADGLQVATLADMNGDGLTDQVFARDPHRGSVYPGKWLVMINAGNSFVGPLDWLLPNSPCGWDGIQMTLDRGRGDVVRDLLDINGDGLPDVVDACNRPAAGLWQVWLNRGAGFNPEPIVWEAPVATIRNLEERRYGGATVSYTYWDTFDADGDRMVDLIIASAETSYPGKIAIHHNGQGAWCPSSNGANCSSNVAPFVARNPFGLRPDLMTQSENGIGGATFLEYEPSTVWDNSDNAGVSHLPWVQWTVAQITRTDGLCSSGYNPACGTAGAHELSTEILYAFGRYEPLAREFRGFRTVVEVLANGHRRIRFFHQDAIRKGKLEATLLVTPGDELLVYETESWRCVKLESFCRDNPQTCPEVACPDLRPDAERYWTRLHEGLRYDTTNHVIRAVSGSTNLGWDAFGNVTRTRRFGSGTKPVETVTVYSAWDEPDRYLVDRARETWTVDDPDGAPKMLQREWYGYDDAGNLTSKLTWVDPVPPGLQSMYSLCPGGGFCSATSLAYTDEGNVREVRDGRGQRTFTYYDRFTSTYPERTVDPMGFVTEFTYDPACGVKIRESVPHDGSLQAAPAAEWRFDGFCRLRAEYRVGDPTWLPENGRGRPYREFAHVLGAPGKPTVVETRTLVADRRWVSRYELYDALGRHLQSQRDGYVDGRRGLVVETTRTYDGMGLLSRKAAPFVIKGRGGSYIAAPWSAGWTLYAYDGLGRTVETVLPDGAVTRQDHTTAWTTTSWDACAVSGACPGAVTVERRDAFGRVVETRTTSEGRLLQAILRTYDGLGRLLTVTQADGSGGWNYATMVVHEYDTRGLLVRRDDPNSGTWMYGYDPNGNRVYENDPTPGRHTSFCFDEKDRVTGKYFSAGDSFTWRCKQPPDVLFVYDTYPDPVDSSAFAADPLGAIGRITRVQERDQVSGGGVISSVYYDLQGRPIAVRVTLDLPGEGTTSAVVRRTFDAAGNLVELVYPDGEVVRHRYDRVGQLYAVLGSRPYARKITYDLFGRPREIRFGNGTKDVRTYAGGLGAFRLRASETLRGATWLQRLFYQSYTANGLVETISDRGVTAGLPELDRSESFTYDGLGRLTSCTLPGSNATISYAYDALGNMVQKEGTRFSYDPWRPHRVATVDGQSAAILYDANGNRITKPGYRFEYDGENRLVRVNGGAVEFYYDHTGLRVGERHAGGPWKRYYFGLVQAEPGFVTKFYFAGKILIASQRVPNQRLASSGTHRSIWLTAAQLPGSGYPVLHLRVQPHLAAVIALVLCFACAVTFLAPGRGLRCFGMRVRSGVVFLCIAAWSTSSLPWPLMISRADAQSVAGEFRYFHLNHLGSTQLVTGGSGEVIVQVRYLPYGGVLGYFDAAGRRLPSSQCAAGAHGCREFTGYEREPVSNLQYAGVRFYDPDFGQFTSLDPVMSLGSPYAYAAWSPVNVTDVEGAFLQFLAAIIVGVLLSAAINAMAAAAQGLPLSKIGQAALTGAITAAVGVGLGIVAGGLALTSSLLAGNVKLTSVMQAVEGLAQVGARAAMSTVWSQAAGEIAKGAGLSEDWVTAISMAAGYYASKRYDDMIGLLGGETSVPSKPGVHLASNTKTHDSITAEAAAKAGFGPLEIDRLVQANREQDAVGKGFWTRAWRLLNNQDHFDVAARRAEAYHLEQIARGGDRLRHLGAASHYVQDRYAFGHMLVGTHLFSGPFRSPIRLLIHQTVGGEVTLHSAAAARTLELFQKYGPNSGGV